MANIACILKRVDMMLAATASGAVTKEQGHKILRRDLKDCGVVTIRKTRKKTAKKAAKRSTAKSRFVKSRSTKKSSHKPTLRRRKNWRSN